MLRKKTAKNLLFLFIAVFGLFVLTQTVLFYLYEYKKFNHLFIYVYNCTDANLKLTARNGRREKVMSLGKKTCLTEKIPLLKNFSDFHFVLSADGKIISAAKLKFPGEKISSFSAYGALMTAVMIEEKNNDYAVTWSNNPEDFSFNSPELEYIRKQDFLDRIWKNKIYRISFKS